MAFTPLHENDVVPALDGYELHEGIEEPGMEGRQNIDEWYEGHTSTQVGDAERQSFLGAAPLEENSNANRDSSDADVHDDYTAIEVPCGYPPLDFRPKVLCNWALALAFLFFGGCMGGIITLTVLYRTQPDRLHIHLTPYRLTSTYLPTVIGSLSALWFRAIVRSYTRLSPYIMMASVPTTSPDGTNDRASRAMDTLSILSYSDFEPVAIVSLMRHGYATVPLVQIVQILTVVFLAPLKTGLLQLTQDGTGWDVSISDVIAYLLISMYAMLLISVTGIFFRLLGTQTGLKWEPASLAAQMGLLNHMNLLEAFYGSEYCTRMQAKSLARTWGRKFGVLRLGYWKHIETGEYVHGIRFIGGQRQVKEERPRQITRSPDNEPRNRSGSEANWSRHSSISISTNTVHIFHWSGWRCHTSVYDEDEKSQNVDGSTVCSPEYARYRAVFLMLLDSMLLVLELIALVCIVISAMHIADGTIHDPIYSGTTPPLGPSSLIPHIADGTTPDPIDARSLPQTGPIGLFIPRDNTPSLPAQYYLLPALLFSLFNIVFFNADVHYRTTQPLHGLSKPQLPEKNLLLDYISPDPISVIFKALAAKHYRVAWHTFLALMGLYPVLVAGRIFNLKIEEGEYHIVVNPTNFYASFGILCLYVLIIPFTRPPTAYRAPRPWFSILDTLSFVYDSLALQAEEFDVQDSTDREEHLRAKVLLKKRLWVFGMYKGVSGRRRLGLSPLRPLGEQRSTVKIVDEITSGFFFDWGFARSYFKGKEPGIVRDGV